MDFFYKSLQVRISTGEVDGNVGGNRHDTLLINV